MSVDAIAALLQPPVDVDRWKAACELIHQTLIANPSDLEARWLDPLQPLFDGCPDDVRLCHPQWYCDTLRGVEHPCVRLVRVWYPMFNHPYTEAQALEAIGRLPNPGPDALGIEDSPDAARMRWLDAWPRGNPLRVLCLRNTYGYGPGRMTLPATLEALELRSFVLHDANALPSLRMLTLAELRTQGGGLERFDLARWAPTLEGLSLHDVPAEAALGWLQTADLSSLTHLALSHLRGMEPRTQALVRAVVERLPRLRVLRLARSKDERALEGIAAALPTLRAQRYDALDVYDPALPEGAAPRAAAWRDAYHPLELRLRAIGGQNSWLSPVLYPPSSSVNLDDVTW